jgi:hypothetical protein
MVGKTVGTNIQIRCYGGSARSKCYADYVDFYLDGDLYKEGKISPIEYSINGRFLMEYNYSFTVPFDVTIKEIEDKLSKRIVHLELEKHAIKIIFYYRGMEVETDEYTTSFFPKRFEIRKGYDPIIQEFFSLVGGNGLKFTANDANLKKAFKAARP